MGACSAPVNHDFVGMGDVKDPPGLFIDHVRIETFGPKQRDALFQDFTLILQILKDGRQVLRPRLQACLGNQPVFAVKRMEPEVRQDRDGNQRQNEVSGTDNRSKTGRHETLILDA